METIHKSCFIQEMQCHFLVGKKALNEPVKISVECKFFNFLTKISISYRFSLNDKLFLRICYNSRNKITHS